MFLKRIFILLIIFFILIILVIFSLSKNRFSTINHVQNNFVVSDITKIASFQVIRNSDTLFVSKNNQGNWILSDSFQINPQYIQLSLKIFSQLMISSLATANINKNIVDSIVQKGIELKLFDIKKTLLKNYLLYPDKTIQKTFIKAKNTDKAYLVEIQGYEGNFAAIFYMPKSNWYNPFIIQLLPQQIKEITVINRNYVEKSFSIHVINNKPYLYNHNNQEIKYLNEAMQAYFLFFRNIRVESFINDNTIANSLKKEKPQFTLIIKDVKENSRHFDIFLADKYQYIAKDKKYYYVLGSSIPNVGIVNYYNIAPILREITFFVRQ